MKTALFAIAFATLPAAAFAHVVIQPGAGAPGAVVEASVIAGHGCSGQATTSVTIAIPDGIGLVHILDTDGWTAKTTEVAGHISTVTWTTNGAGTAGPQTFKMHIGLPKTAGRIYFPAVQNCGATQVNWDEHASDTGPAPTHPAPSINVGGDAAPMPDMSHMDHSH